MDDLWRKDIQLKDICNVIDKYEVFSFDVFDTLLFRMCKDTAYVYRKTAKLLSEQFDDWDYAVDEFAQIRENARRIARGKKVFEEGCTYQEIYENIPLCEEWANVAKDVEIQEEKRVLFLNPSTYSLMKFLYKNNKKIVITSDMYFGKTVILSLLEHAGVNLEYLSQCYVSSEYNSLKMNGGLFGHVLQDLCIDPDKMLHIGDDKVSDVDGAHAVGIQTLQYSVLDKRYASIYDLEVNLYEMDLYELYPIRNIASMLRISNDNEGNIGEFLFGARVLAPIVVAYLQYIKREQESDWKSLDITRLINWLSNVDSGILHKQKLNEKKKLLEMLIKRNNCQQGISSYWSVWENVHIQHPELLEEVLQKREELIKIWIRWICYPSNEEQKMLRGIQYE